MRLLDAVLDVNQRRVAGDRNAWLGAEVEASLPLAALTCIDPRLNRLIPDMLGIADDKFVWLRNAGNIITGPLSTMMRSLAMACAIKGAREIAIVGHGDCLVGKTSAMELADRLRSFGVERSQLPANLAEFFGLFGDERQNVLRSVRTARVSPLIGPRVPVHGLWIDVDSGRLEWVINGYEGLETAAAAAGGSRRGIRFQV